MDKELQVRFARSDVWQKYLRRTCLLILSGMYERQCLITEASHPSLGDNLNGPCVIEVPSWVQSPLGRYYLYFAHHEGKSIRLAFADTLLGPWTIHAMGVLNLEETPFIHIDLPASADNQFNYAHIASPNIHIDESTREFVMYYHGLEADGTQPTRVCFSKDGLIFSSHSNPLADSYFAGFAFQSAIYGLTLGGRLCRGNGWLGPFEYADNAFCAALTGLNGETTRHCGVCLDGDLLTIFFTRIGDAPERILVSTCRLSGDWKQWRASPPAEVIRPTECWEGVNSPVKKSRAGKAEGMEHALRDPYPIGQHLFYAGGGESIIGVTQLPKV